MAAPARIHFINPTPDKEHTMGDRGFFAIGIEHSKHEQNIGTLFRSAVSFGASFIFTVGRRYERQASDTVGAGRHVPLFNYDSIDSLVSHLPFSCPLVGIEIDPGAVLLEEFEHPIRACYLLGAEDHGLTKRALDRVHKLVKLPGRHCLNVSVAGSIVMYDRIVKGGVGV